MHRLLCLIPLLITVSDHFRAWAQPSHATTNVPPTVRRNPKFETPDTYTGRQIMVGSGGGFTGAFTTYYLLDNGRLFGKRSIDSTFTFINKQTTASTKRTFAVLENSCNIKSITYDNPGNTYRFVGWKKSAQDYKVTWAPADQSVPVACAKFYTSFMALIPKSARL